MLQKLAAGGEPVCKGAPARAQATMQPSKLLPLRFCVQTLQSPWGAQGPQGDPWLSQVIHPQGWPDQYDAPLL